MWVKRIPFIWLTSRDIICFVGQEKNVIDRQTGEETWTCGVSFACGKFWGIASYLLFLYADFVEDTLREAQTPEIWETEEEKTLSIGGLKQKYLVFAQKQFIMENS